MKELALAFLVTVTVIAVIGHWRAEAKQPPAPAQTQWVEPYGGCKEAADYPGSPGYKDCVAHGWNPPVR